MNLLLFVLAAYGLTFFHCSMCIGWWVGLFLWALNRYTELFTFDYSIATAFILACISSGTSYVLNMVFGDEGINFKKTR